MLSSIDWSQKPSILFAPLFLGASVREVSRLEDAFEVLIDADRSEKITSSRLEGVRSTLNRAIERAWDSSAAKEKVWDATSYDVGSPRTFIQSKFPLLNIGSLHEVSLLGSKILTLKNQKNLDDLSANCVAELETFYKIFSELASLVKLLKKNIVKATSSEKTTSINPKQVRGNCPCCLRDIAVVDGRIARHGYRRFDRGASTANCYGAGYAPIQSSVAGVEAYRDYIASVISQDKHSLLSKVERLPYRNSSGRGMPEYIEDGHPEWGILLEKRKKEIASRIHRLERLSKEVNDRIATWSVEWQGKPLRGRASLPS